MALPFSATRLEGRDLDVRKDRLPGPFRHPNPEIDDVMDDIVYNAIDLIQEKCKDSDLRIFYYNMMSVKGYDNRDFEDLVQFIADAIDISVQDGRHRDPINAVIPAVEDVVTLHVGYMVDEFPDLEKYIDRSMERNVDKAINTYEKYRIAVEAYRRNDRRSGTRSRGRGRDDRDDRGRGRGRDDDRDDDRGGNRRRDRWERGAVRGGVRGEPRRSVTTRDNLYGNTDQSDRFSDDLATSSRTSNNRDDGNRDRDDRNNDRSSSRSRDDDRYDEGVPLRPSRTEAREERPARVQKLPYSRNDDIEDALERESNTPVEKNMSRNNDSVVDLVNTANPLIQAFVEQEAWLPTAEHPHPLVFNHKQDLFYEMDLENKVVIPRCILKEKIVDYYAHRSMAFGETPRDFKRFEDGGIETRLSALHTALLNPTEEMQINDTDKTVTYHSRIDYADFTYLSYGLKDVMYRLNYRRLAQEGLQPNGETNVPVEIASGKAMIIDAFLVTLEEHSLLEELRHLTTFTKLCEKMRPLSKRVRPELFAMLDSYLTKNVNRMLRQNLSIPGIRISSFTSDWLDLFALVSKEYGESYRDAININQERELRHLLGGNAEADAYVTSQVGEGNLSMRPFVIGMPTKVIYVNEVGFNLDVDMVPNVASQLLPEVNPFFHDLAQDLLTIKASDFGRFFIQTSDMRVIEASRSYLNDKAVLLRMVH